MLKMEMTATLYDLTFGFNFLRVNLGMSRKDIVRCYVMGLPY